MGLTLLLFAIPTEKDGILCHGMSRFDTVLGEYKINGESQIAEKASVHTNRESRGDVELIPLGQ